MRASAVPAVGGLSAWLAGVTRAVTAPVGTYYTETNLRGTNLLNSAALYLGGETPFGPAFLGIGYSTNGASNLFLSIGIP